MKIDNKPKNDEPKEKSGGQKKIEELEKQNKEYLNGWKRERADFLNYKKEEMERIRELMEYANEELIIKFLPILDNLEIAEKKLPENLKQDENVKGILQIKKQILDFLKSQGVEEIKTIGEKFNPNFHEVAEGVELKDKESGNIIEEIQKGYLLQGRVIRPARVKIAK